MRKAFSLNSSLNLGYFLISGNSNFLNSLTIIILIFLVKVPLETTAQSISPQVISVSSSSVNMDGDTFSFSMGESLTNTIQSGEMITQGFLQPKHLIPCTDFTLIAYPNPTEKILNMAFEGCDDKIERAAIIDIFGKVLLDDRVPDNQIDLQELKTGIYFLKVFNENGKELGIIKIAKVTK